MLKHLIAAVLTSGLIVAEPAFAQAPDVNKQGAQSLSHGDVNKQSAQSLGHGDVTKQSAQSLGHGDVTKQSAQSLSHGDSSSGDGVAKQR